MKTIPVLLFFSLFFLTSLSHSQDTISAKYFPLKVGNIWIYYVETFPPLQNPIRVHSITKDTMINNHKYFFYQSYLSEQWLRYDSSKGNLLAFSPSGGCSNYNSDRIIDSLSSSVGDVIFCQYQAGYILECTNISSVEVFNVQTTVKRFEHDGLILQYIDYAEDIGKIWTASGEPPPTNSYERLKGCVINGKVYGDAALTSIQLSNNYIPMEFSLYQNYPNPFNPQTIIHYSIPPNFRRQMSDVRLSVYNSLGEEIAVLVNEKQNAGNYEVIFDGSNLPSGLYFYKLQTENFSETKRMILLK